MSSHYSLQHKIRHQIEQHEAWLGAITGLHAEKLLRVCKVPYLFILREGETADIHLMIQDFEFWGERDKVQSKRSGPNEEDHSLKRKADEEDRLGNVAASPKFQILNHEVYNYYVTFIQQDLSIKHQPFQITITKDGWHFENGGAGGPYFHKSFNEVLPLIMHCKMSEPSAFSFSRFTHYPQAV